MKGIKKYRTKETRERVMKERDLKIKGGDENENVDN